MPSDSNFDEVHVTKKNERNVKGKPACSLHFAHLFISLSTNHIKNQLTQHTNTMKKTLASIIVLCISIIAVNAQDVIVKKDGSTILSKILEVNPNDVKYKKFSNPNGPTYTIIKSEIMSINYENGDKDVFNTAQPSEAGKSFGVNPKLQEDNLQLVREYNSIQLTPKTGKKSNDDMLTFLMGLKEGSVIETPELKVTFTMKHWFGRVTMFGNKVKNERILDLGEDPAMRFYNHQYKLVVTLKNKTDNTIYVDLANSFILRDNQANPYFTAGESYGRYTQRVISIPPMSSLSLEPQNIGQGDTWVTTRNSVAEYDIIKSYMPYFTEKGYSQEKKNSIFLFDKLEKGGKVDIPLMPEINPLSVHITYSLDEKITTSQNMHMDFYLRQVLRGDNWDYSNGALIFYNIKSFWKILKT